MELRTKMVILGTVAEFGLLAAVSVSPLFAQQGPMPTPGAAPTHEQMHQMMDSAHGPETSQRMHEAMGSNGEQLMDQCVSMMSSMQGMMGAGGMSGMMGSQSVQDMVGR